MAGQDPWTPYDGKYKIHEESREFAKICIDNDEAPFWQLGTEEARQRGLAARSAVSGEIEFDGEDTEIIVPSPYSTDGIPVSVYKHASRPEVPAILIYFHGGGLVICSRKTHETITKIMARDSGAIVLNVEYRLLPNPSAPYAPFEDVEVVTRWVLENKEAVSGNPNSKVGVCGDSAGGQLAIGVTNEIQGLDFQILVVPTVDFSMKQDTVQEFKQILGFNHEINFFNDNAYNQIPDLLTNPRVNGMARTNTASSPPALIILAELDPFRGCGIDYADKLRAAGVKVQLEIIQGVPHTFFHWRSVFRTTSAQVYDHMAKFLKQFQ